MAALWATRSGIVTERFTHAVPNPRVRRDIALAVADGISPEQLAAEFGIGVSTVRTYAKEFEGVRRKVQALTEDDRQQIRDGVARGARRRYEREYGAEVVRQVIGE
jgi:hypothetical protein